MDRGANDAIDNIETQEYCQEWSDISIFTTVERNGDTLCIKETKYQTRSCE